MKTINWKYSIGIILIGLGILTFKPIPIASEHTYLISKGIVVDIYEGGHKDAVFKLKGQNKIFYINRGLLRGLDLLNIKNELINKEITIKYPRYWTPLDPLGFVKQVSKIETGGKTIFNEMN
ncbi:MAG: hypothetical protein IPO86_10170 [Saprospiraceae bacterium]|nr:hypothetical protein [Saprospiraceae bacterium]MBK9728472.1 hypothetical protein [Saprospiraceae bacterium]